MSVQDNGVPSYISTAQVTILVEDVNDHPPRFILDVYEGMVVEDDHTPQPGQLVEMVSAGLFFVFIYFSVGPKSILGTTDAFCFGLLKRGGLKPRCASSPVLFSGLHLVVLTDISDQVSM